MSKIEIDKLEEAGFMPVCYRGQEGTFFRRDTLVSSMPYLGAHTDDEYIYGECIACTEVSPNGLVTLLIAETEYREEAVPLASEEGQALVRDARDGRFVDTDIQDAFKRHILSRPSPCAKE